MQVEGEHQLSLALYFDTKKKIARRTVRIDIITHYSDTTRPLSLMMHEEQQNPQATSLDILRDIYQRHGLRHTPPYGQMPPQLMEPVLVAPDFEYFKLYPLLGMTSLTLAQTIREFAADFSLANALRQIAHDYDVPLELVFPPNVDLQDLVVSGTAVAEAEAEDRVIPVFMLPQVLTLLPECYQSATNNLFQLENLQYALPHAIPVGEYCGFVAKQVLLLGQNRRYVSFLYQNAFQCYAGPLRDTERALLEAALHTARELARKEADIAAGERRKIRKLVRALVASTEEQQRCTKKRKTGSHTSK